MRMEFVTIYDAFRVELAVLMNFEQTSPNELSISLLGHADIPSSGKQTGDS